MDHKTLLTALREPADVDRIAQTANYYGDGKFAVEIYANGTCVFPRVTEDKGVHVRDEQLRHIADGPIDFTVREMDDHNFVVRFSDTVFSIVFQDEWARRREEIAKEIERDQSSEILLGKPNAPKDHLLIGLLARTRLLADIESPTVSRSVAPVRK
jgi:hypothetical protein